MSRTGKEFIQGTAARQLEYDVYENNPVLKTKRQAKNNAKAKVKTVFMTLLVFAMGLMIISRYALITETNYKIEGMKETYNTLKNENSVLKVQLERETDLSQIKELAETKLGMRKPVREQIVYVKVPNKDTTTVSEVMKNDDSGSFLAAVENRIDQIIDLLN